MIKAVLDTNILISATIARGNEFEILGRARDGEYGLILSPDILEEFEKVVSRARFGLTKDIIKKIINSIIVIAEIAEPKEKLKVITDDPEDNKFLECALAGPADYIVSGDGHLLNLREFKGIKIVKSKRFLEILG